MAEQASQTPSVEAGKATELPQGTAQTNNETGLIFDDHGGDHLFGGGEHGFVTGASEALIDGSDGFDTVYVIGDDGVSLSLADSSVEVIAAAGDEAVYDPSLDIGLDHPLEASNDLMVGSAADDLFMWDTGESGASGEHNSGGWDQLAVNGDADGWSVTFNDDSLYDAGQNDTAHNYLDIAADGSTDSAANVDLGDTALFDGVDPIDF